MSNLAYGTFTITNLSVVTSVDVYYYNSTSSTSLSGGSWQTTTPTWTNGKYIWSKTVTTWEQGVTTQSQPVCITGQKGSTGSTGQSVTSIVEQYALSTSNTTAPTTGWSNAMPAFEANKYYWTRSKITWANPTNTTYTDAVLANGITSANTTANAANTTAAQANQTANTANQTANTANQTANAATQAAAEAASAAAAAQSTANTATSIANGKNTIYYGANFPAGGTYKAGDTFFKQTAEGYIIYKYDTTDNQWVKESLDEQGITQITNAKIANLDGGKINAGTITSLKLSTDAIKSRNYQAGTAPYSGAGTFLDLTQGNIYTPNFGVNNDSLDSIDDGAYIRGSIYAHKGTIGQSSTNYWYIGNYKDYNQVNSAMIKGYGTATIQLGESNTWRLNTNRIHTAWNDDSSANEAYRLHYLTRDSKYWDMGLHVPTAGIDKFIYIRSSKSDTSTANILENLQNSLEDNLDGTNNYWTYKFFISADGGIYARNIYAIDENGNYTLISGANGAYLLKSGGTIQNNLVINGTLQVKGNYLNKNGSALTLQTNLGSTTAGTLTGNTSSAISIGVTGTLPVTNGGTGKNQYSTIGGVIYVAKSNNITTLNSTDVGTSGYLLQSGGAGMPTWINPATLTVAAATKATQDGDGNVIKTTYLKLSGGNVTGPVSFGDSVSVDDLNAGTLVVTGNASFINGINTTNVNGGQPIYTVIGTQTATTASWTGNLPITALYDGLTIAYYLPRTSANNVTLNLTLANGTTTGAIPVYITSTTRMTTHYGAGSTILLTYWSAGSISVNGTATTQNRWTSGDYWNSNDTGYYHRRVYPNIKAGAGKIYPYTLIMQRPDGRWESLVTSNSTDITKERNTNGFLLGHVLLMYANATYNQNSNVGTYNIWSAHSGLIDHRYSFNTANDSTNGTIGYKPIYLVGTIGSDGLFYLDTKWWTQTLPSSVDNKVYIYIGDAYDYYRMTFTEDKPIYCYYNNGIKLYTGLKSETATSNGTNISLVTTGQKYLWNSKTSNTGTVTSVAASGSGGITISGSPITTSGTLAIGLNLSTAINGLGEGTSAANRNDYAVVQYAGGGTTTTSYHRRKLSNVFAALNSSDITTALGFTPYNATNPDGYTTNTGTVTSVRVQASSPLQSSTSTAQSSSLNTTISFVNQNANVVLAGPSSGDAAAPAFRALVAADIPSLTKSKISDFPTTWALSSVSGADDLKAIEALTGTSGFLKKTAANTWSLDTNTYLTTHQTVTDKNPTLAWGTKSAVATIGSTTINVTMPANPNYTANLITGASNSAKTTAAASNGSVFLNLVENNTVRNYHNLKGGNGLTVTSDANGVVTFTSPAAFTGVSFNDGKLTFTKSDGNSAELTTSSFVITQAAGATGLVNSSGTGLNVGGATTKPVYFSNGVPVEVTSIPYTLLSGVPSTMTPASHTHGNIQNGGTLQTTDITIANGDKLIVTDASDSNKIARTNISFDGTTATKALTQKGTWETFNNYSLPLATNGTRGGVQIGYSSSGKNYAVQLSSQKMYVNVPWQNTTYSAGTGLSLSGTTFNHSNSVTAGTAGTSDATSSTNRTIAIPYITYDAQGHITASGTHTHTLTSFPQAYLSWGGQNFSGSYGCIDAAMVPELGANRFAFLKAAGLQIDYSTDAGATWVSYGATDIQKVNLFANGGSFNLGKATAKANNTINNQLRVIITTNLAGIYTTLNKIVIYMSTNGNNTQVKIERAKKSSPDNYVTHLDWTPISGWSGWNILNISGLTTYGNTDSQQQKIKMTFRQTSVNSNYPSPVIQIIKGFGGMGWTSPSTMAKTGHLYSYDGNQNATFPAQITATQFNGPLNGNATTASWVNLLKPIDTTTTASASTWSIPSGSKQVWGERFSDSTLTYTPSGGSATAITDTGDWVIWLTPNATANNATLNMKIDGTYYGSFNGNLSGNASTATEFSSNATITLTGDTTGTSAGSKKSWSIATTTNQITSSELTNQDLNNYKTLSKVLFYYGGGSNTVSNKPSGINQFGVFTYNTAVGHVTQELSANNRKWIRFWNNSTWSSWQKFITDSNYTDYTVTKTGTGASGDWGISITGNAATASRLKQNTEMTYGWSGINYFNISAANQSAAKVNDTPFSSATWTHILRFNHGNNSGYYTDLAVPFNANSLYYKRIVAGSLQNTSTNGGWVKILDQLNYTDYTVTKTGTGASGSWGISVTGTASNVTGTVAIANGGTGKTTGKDAANYFLNSLDTGSSTPVDADYYISQYVNGGTTTTTYHRRPMTALWNYIKEKGNNTYVTTDSTAQTISGTKTFTGGISMKSSTTTNACNINYNTSLSALVFSFV